MSPIDTSLRRCKHCKKEYDGKTSSNLATHLKLKHPYIYYKVIDKNSTEIEKERYILVQNMAEMITLGGRPFEVLWDSGFQMIIRDKLDKFAASGCPLSFEHNLVEVKDYIQVAGGAVRDLIKKEVRGKALSLIVDIGTKNNRSIFGVSLQYIHNGKLRNRAICMKELEESHTGEYLCKIVQDNLKLYDIDIEQIMTVTTDNGANVLKMVRDITATLQDETAQNTPNESPTVNATNEYQYEAEIEDFIASAEDISDDDFISSMEHNLHRNEAQSVYEALCNELNICLDVVFNITGLNCLAHTLQLAVGDALKMLGRNYENTIKLCRMAAKKLRTDLIRSAYKDRGGAEYTKPTLDVKTRWGSLALMVRIVL